MPPLTSSNNATYFNHNRGMCCSVIWAEWRGGGIKGPAKGTIGIVPSNIEGRSFF